MRQSCFFPTPHPLIVISAKAEIQGFGTLVVETSGYPLSRVWRSVIPSHENQRLKLITTHGKPEDQRV